MTGPSDCPTPVESTAKGASTLPARHAGAGTELTRLLKRLRIFPGGSCRCTAQAEEMDRRGVVWCHENIDIIVGRLRDEAADRKLPFLEPAARLLVKRAILLADQAERRRQNHPSTGDQRPVEGQ